MLSIGFTSSRTLTGEQKKFLMKDIVSLASVAPKGTTWVTGGCIGGDSLIGRTLAKLRPSDSHVILVPANRAAVEYWWDSMEFCRKVIAMPARTTYKDRNLEIVKWSTSLVGYPLFPEKDVRSQRSGTWQTIRMARSANLKIVVKILSN